MKNEANIVAVAAEVRRVADLLGLPPGTAPSLSQYREHGRIPPGTVVVVLSGRYLGRRGASWAKVMEEKLRLQPYHDAVRPTPQDIIDDLTRVAFKLGRHFMPTTWEYRKHGKYSLQTVYRKLLPEGANPTWENVAIAAGLKHKQKKPRKKIFDVAKQQELIRIYREVAEKLGYRPGGPGPTRGEWREHAPKGAPGVVSHFGSFSALVEAAGFVSRATTPATSREVA